MNHHQIHHFENPFKVIKQLLAGKSLTRSLFNLAIERYEIHGDVLDLGSKNGTSSYYQHIKQSADCKITFTDLVPGPGVSQVDVEKPFPFPDACFDTVITFHLMEHVYEFWHMPKEIYRVLKPGGTLIVAVPFIHEYHGDPNDYWRMSDDALCRLFESAGFLRSSVEFVGEGMASFATVKIISLLLPRFIKRFGMVFGYLLATVADRLTSALRGHVNGRTIPVRFSLDVICEFKKPDTFAIKI